MSEQRMSEHTFQQVAQAMADMTADHDKVLAEVVAERDRLRAAVDAALALPRWDHLDAYEELTGQCVDVDDLRRALAPVADPDPHTTSDKETVPDA